MAFPAVPPREPRTTTPTQHVVHRSLSGDAYTSLRQRATPREERHALGKSMRHQVPRSSLALWSASARITDPIDLVIGSHRGRRPELIPLRVERMLASPYGFLRGAAIVMAADFATLPATGITPVICGDSHVGNFGFYASPERDLVIDLNDFDEAHPGSWEWDLRRLTASIWVAGRENGFSEDDCETAVRSCVEAYREQVRELAEQPLMSRSFQRVDVDSLRESTTDVALHKGIDRAAKKARRSTSDRALPRFSTEEGGRRRIVEEPPLIAHLPGEEYDAVASGLDEYLGTLSSHWRRVLGGYTLIDLAQKVVGVGSVGLRAYVALCEGSSPDDVIFLQLKQARRSVVAPFMHGDSAWHDHQGQRVVEYQQALQTVSDPLLGWTTIDGRQFYVRQFRNMKGSLPLDSIGAPAMTDYVRVCGRLLAKGHARTSGASMIAGYAGTSDRMDGALARFASLYADQTEADHAAFTRSVNAGRLPHA